MYHNDHRVRGGRRGGLLRNVNKRTMTARLMTNDLVDGREVPIEFVLCPTCNGRGSHVNPSVDCHGISAEEFAEDPSFAEDYFSGVHDVTCYECGGDRVVPVPRNSEDKRELVEWCQEMAAMDAEMAAERRMGA